MTAVYLEVLSERQAVQRIGPQYEGYKHDVAVFGDGSDTISLDYKREEIENDYCLYCSHNPLFLPTARCTGVFIEEVDGVPQAIAEAPHTLFTRRNALACCRNRDVKW